MQEFCPRLEKRLESAPEDFIDEVNEEIQLLKKWKRTDQKHIGDKRSVILRLPWAALHAIAMLTMTADERKGIVAPLPAFLPHAGL